MSKALIKEALSKFTLADLDQPEITNIGKNKDKQWLTFTKSENKIKKGKKVEKDENTENDKNTELSAITPISFSEPVIMCLCLIFDKMISLIKKSGKMHHEKPLDKSINEQLDQIDEKFNIIKILYLITQKKNDYLLPTMKRNFLFVEKIIIQLNDNFKGIDSSIIDPGASDIANLYLDFLKTIAYACCWRIRFTQKRLTLNFMLFKSILMDMAIVGDLFEMKQFYEYLDISAEIKKNKKVEDASTEDASTGDEAAAEEEDEEDEEEDAVDEEEEEN